MISDNSVVLNSGGTQTTRIKLLQEHALNIKNNTDYRRSPWRTEISPQRTNSFKATEEKQGVKMSYELHFHTSATK